MRITVDSDRCEGHGLCEHSAPDVFALGDEGAVTILIDPVPRALAAQAETGVRSCPVAALTATES